MGLWKKCIIKDEILGEKYLKIGFAQNAKIFDCKNIENNEKENNISVLYSDNCALIEFDYLKSGNGAIIDVLHNGERSSEITPFFIEDESVLILTSLVLEFVCGGLFILLVLYLRNSFYLKPKDLYR